MTVDLYDCREDERQETQMHTSEAFIFQADKPPEAAANANRLFTPFLPVPSETSYDAA
jgi:hypothetical protein